MGDIYNIGTQKERTVLDVARDICKLFNLPVSTLLGLGLGFDVGLGWRVARAGFSGGCLASLCVLWSVGRLGEAMAAVVV